ncbi:hypothetical protein TTHERM_000420059 (macronuclear) [Tetrahymena thermophila SB210]|uniref:Uncharacterized protein n=1 Tax=Tetrahymena thermophila (strain SB210) TaxID=312017 RepID=W7X5H0_TETTS|nr:hypothetical protein TTHERM_000420059 [Tetrahymena thermophila SB210]EWS72642.1 hypothetical protein TTHERM_000420059 [Tetrahymena thermophila SB210]|eukprot:XP_012654810.1 hypothetical protein TTHERM_000420059 [Tetrahymena thermophila SB210]
MPKNKNFSKKIDITSNKSNINCIFIHIKRIKSILSSLQTAILLLFNSIDSFLNYSNLTFMKEYHLFLKIFLQKRVNQKQTMINIQQLKKYKTPKAIIKTILAVSTRIRVKTKVQYLKSIYYQYYIYFLLCQNTKIQQTLISPAILREKN